MARYHELKETLKQKIFSGTYPEGSLLPSEKELSDEYAVNRHTIRHALEVLVKEGYISKHKGKGSVVTKVRHSLGLLSFIGFSEALRSADIKVDTSILSGPEKTNWPNDFFLSLEDNEKSGGCYLLSRLRMANREPVMVEKTYLPQCYFNDFEKQQLVNGSLFETLLKKYSLEMIDLQQDIKALLPNDFLTKTLRIKKKTPLLYIRRKYVTSKSNVFVYSELFVNTSNFTISNNTF